MSVIEMILGGIATLLAVGFSGFIAGNIRGTGKAEAKANQQRAEEHAAAAEAVADRRVEVTKEASNVQQTVNHMPDDDVDSELRESWKRPGSR